MARIVVVGGGIGGLSAALLLGRAGHHVTVCERDPAPTPVTADDAWTAWPRPGTPQARLGHSFLAGFQRGLHQRLPDVLDAVLAAGAPQLDMTVWMADGVVRVPQDSELSIVRARRPVVEAVLRRAAEAEPTVQVRAGCRVQGLLADPPRPRDVPRVTGVATPGGAITADVVIVSGGRSVQRLRRNGRKAADRPATHVTSRCWAQTMMTGGPTGGRPSTAIPGTSCMRFGVLITAPSHARSQYPSPTDRSRCCGRRRPGWRLQRRCLSGRSGSIQSDQSQSLPAWT